MSVPSEGEDLKKYSSGTLVTTSGSEQYTDLPQNISEDSVHGVSRISMEIYTDVEEYSTTSLCFVGMEGRIHPTFHSWSYAHDIYTCRT